MSDNKTEVTIGPGVLFLTFLVLKLTHEIDWSWWWVAAPLWMPPAIALAIVVVMMAVAAGVVAIVALVVDR